MAILRKQKKEAVVKKEVAAPAVSISPAASVLIRPRVTEKATLQNTMNVYVFEVTARATKKTVGEAVKALYKVTPRKVAVVPVRRKATFVRGRKGHTSGGRKAYVYLKPEDKIEL